MTNDAPHKRPRAHWIEHEDELEALAERLKTEPRVAIDTEANSLHAYHERTCIIQVSTPEHDDIVDALAFESLAPLRDALSRPDVEIVMHGGDYDVTMLTRDHDFGFDQVFDTMLAATVLGEERLGLAALVDQHFDLQLDKRFQRADWARRPVSSEQMTYLQRDTIFLLPLRKIYAERLIAADLVEEAEIEFRRTARRVGEHRVPDPERWRRMKGANRLHDEGRAVMHALWAWREGVASDRDLPAFKVLQPKSMLGLAENPPREARHPGDLPLLGPRERGRHGKAILAAIERGLKAHARGEGPAASAKPALSPEDAQRVGRARKREDRLREWRKGEAARRDVPNLVVLPNPAMHWLVGEQPTSLEALAACQDLGRKRIERYGEALLRAVRD